MLWNLARFSTPDRNTQLFSFMKTQTCRARLISLLLVTLIGCFNPISSYAQKQQKETLQSVIDDFQDQLEMDVSDDNINGSISAAIIKDNKIIWSKAFGYSDRESKIKADTSSIFRVGSITKSFTAFLMMELAEEGKIKLNDPIELYFPEVKKLEGYSDSTRITFAQLASHTSGLIREPKLKSADEGPIAEWENKVIASLPMTSFDSRPGESFNYSNIGYAILGLALSRAAHVPYIELMEKKIFKPLHMNNTFFILPESKKASLARGLDGGPLGKINTEVPLMEIKGRGYKVPNGGIFSTPGDIAKFIMCSMGYFPLLKKESLESMQTAKNPPNDHQDKYGFGVGLFQDGPFNIVEHAGGVSGYISKFSFDKDSHYGVVVMRNYMWGVTDINLRTLYLLRKLKSLE
jgi:CubicO group peptidase (beta-lactamase class C family)